MLPYIIPIVHPILVYIFIFISFLNKFLYFRIARAYFTPRPNIRLVETVAGKLFLATLRQHHEEDDEDLTKRHNRYPFEMESLKHKRKELRSELEGLLVEYLHNLAPHPDENTRKKRDNFYDSEKMISDLQQSADQIEPLDNKKTYNNNNKLFDEYVANDVDDDSDNFNLTAFNKTSAIRLDNSNKNRNRVQIGVRNITIDEKSVSENITDKLENSNDAIASSAKSECNERRQKITVLDRYDLDNSIRNGTNAEHNIRQLLNYR